MEKQAWSDKRPYQFVLFYPVFTKYRYITRISFQPYSGDYNQLICF